MGIVEPYLGIETELSLLECFLIDIFSTVGSQKKANVSNTADGRIQTADRKKRK